MPTIADALGALGVPILVTALLAAFTGFALVFVLLLGGAGFSARPRYRRGRL